MGQPTTLDLFAGELRRARVAGGRSQEALGVEINFSASLIAKIELGQRRPSRDFAKRCDLALDTGGLLSRIHEVLGHGPVMPWFREWIGIEQEALALRSYELSVVPGLLQTEAYARALLGSSTLLGGDEVEKHLTTRMERQEILLRGDPPHFTAVLDEQVLRRPVGGPEVMRDQLLHLAKVCAAQPRVRAQIVPISAGAYAGLSGPFVIATLSGGDDIAFLDDQVHGQLVDRAEEVIALRQTWDSIRGEALSHQQSIELMVRVAETWI